MTTTSSFMSTLATLASLASLLRISYFRFAIFFPPCSLAVKSSSASVMLFGRDLFWNDKCDRAFVERVVIRVFQFNEHFVRTGEQPHQDDWVATRVCPHPGGIVDSHMNVSDARRDRQSIGA